jgi:hypothetical protein
VSTLLQVDPLKRPNATQALKDLSLVTPTQRKHPIQTVRSTAYSTTNLFETSPVMIQLSRGTRIPLGTKFPLKKSYLKTEKISNDGETEIDFGASGINDSFKGQSRYDFHNLDDQCDVKQNKVNKRRHGFFNSIFRFRKEKL